MSRPIRIEFPGALYHVSNRGAVERSIVKNDADRRAFLHTMGSVVSRCRWLLHSYVLMHDHYHLIVETPKANLSEGMRQLNGVYTQYFNRTHQSEGTLFQGRFKGILFEREDYLLDLCRHVVLNPVRVGRSTSTDKYRWSSHRAMAGLVKTPDYLHTDAVLAHFGKRDRDSRRKYRQYVRDGVKRSSPLKQRSNQILLGGSDFRREMQALLNGELVKRGPKRVTRRRSLRSIFKDIETKPKSERNQLIVKAHIDHTYTLQEIGNHLGLHYTTVSKVINA
jgi:REP element-mobilizing transposase RayT|tara:strand:+ start:7440 stop:8276 length:837 start_codon:yes stop_codon:yes gene_type:complete